MASEKPGEGSELGMDVICRFSGHLAHELNNLLTPIIACGQMLKDGIKKNDPLYFCAEQISDAGERCLSLSRKLQIIGSRRAAGHVIDITSLIHEALKTVKLPSDRTVKIVEVPVEASEAEGMQIKADMDQFIFLITEMVNNAIESMPQGGTVKFGVSLKKPAGREQDSDAPDGWVQIAIKDQGTGMSPEVQARMYEPYFSTYGQEKDKGLGLTLVYGIVRRSGGVIECQSAPGEGTTFNLYFPRKLNADRKATR